MKYYYLISSLPDLSPEANVKQIDFEEAFDSIKRNLEAEDLQQFRYLLYPQDNQNLLHHLFHEHKSLPLAGFERPGTLSEEAIATYKKEQSSFPDYLMTFLQETEAQFPSLTMREMANRLQIQFEEQVERHAGDFIRQYFVFKRSLTEVVAACQQANYAFLSESQFTDENPLLDSLKRGHALSSMVLKDYPYAESLKATLDTADPIQIESYLAQLEWEYLESSNQTFESEQVLAYTIRLLILYRQKGRDQARGLARFNVLKEEIENKVHSPKTPVV